MSGQNIISVWDIKGTAFIAGDVSENQARANALNDAKVNALKKAGIEENISTYQALFSSQVNNNFSQFFSSDIQNEMQGAIKSYKITDERKFVNSANEFEYEIIIDADVIKYDTKPDISFDANIEGIKSAYNNGDKLSFIIKTTQDAYLNIFNITDNEAFLLYPNIIEKQQLLEKDKDYKFPQTKIDYTLQTTQKKQETNRLIFVFTKDPIAYISFDGDEQITPTDEIFTWLYSIMPDRRKVEYFSFIILK